MLPSLDLHEDSQDAKFDLVFSLAQRLDLLPPVYVISHARAGRVRTLKTLPVLNEMPGVLVVAEHEMAEYQRHHGRRVLLPIPESFGPRNLGVGRARQWSLDTADVLGHDHAIVLDDDLTLLSVLWGAEPGRASRAFAGRVEGRREEFFLGVFMLFVVASLEAFERVPSAMISSHQNQNANRTPAASEARYQVNLGGNPGLAQAWHVRRFLEATGGLDLARWNDHGDDIGAVVQILNAGGSVIKVPSIIGNSLDCETDSVIRTPESAPRLRQAEHDHLMADPLGPYVKTKYDLIDRPQWHSLDWRRLARDGRVTTGSAPWAV